MEENVVIKNENTPNIPEQYKPLSAWAYFGYQILFSIPFIGFILLIVFAFNNDNINRRNFARSYFCTLVLVVILVIIILTIATSIGIAGAYIPNIDRV